MHAYDTLHWLVSLTEGAKGVLQHPKHPLPKSTPVMRGLILYMTIILQVKHRIFYVLFVPMVT